MLTNQECSSFKPFYCQLKETPCCPSLSPPGPGPGSVLTSPPRWQTLRPPIAERAGFCVEQHESTQRPEATRDEGTETERPAG